MTSTLGDSKDGRFQGHFAELLKVEGKLALREPAGLAMGIGFPIILLVIFGIIGIAVPGNVAGTGHTVLDIYVPVIMVVGFISLGISSLPVTLVKYREMGWLRRVSTTPTPPSRLLAAQLTLNLVLALATILIVIFGSELVFGATLDVGIPYFVLSIVLSIQPATVGGPLATIMYYSPSGAAAQALLYSVFNAAPPVTAVVTMVVYTGFFAFIATRYFRWG